MPIRPPVPQNKFGGAVLIFVILGVALLWIMSWLIAPWAYCMYKYNKKKKASINWQIGMFVVSIIELACAIFLLIDRNQISQSMGSSVPDWAIIVFYFITSALGISTSIFFIVKIKKDIKNNFNNANNQNTQSVVNNAETNLEGAK